MIYILLNFTKKFYIKIGIEMHAVCGALPEYWL